jgi:hypothetical protein
MGTEPVPPKIPNVGDKLGDLDDWESSEDPYEGRINADSDDDCDQEHADR